MLNVRRALSSVSIWILIAAFITGLFVVLQSTKADAAGLSDANQITEWQILWEKPGEKMTIEHVSRLSDDEGWVAVQAGGEYPALPPEANAAWLKFKLPSAFDSARPALYLDKLYTRDLQIYLQGEKIFERTRNYPFDRNNYVIPIAQNESNRTVLMRMDTFTDRIGLHDSIKVGDHQLLSNFYMRIGLFDNILGAVLLLLAVFLFLSIMLSNRKLFSQWNALGIVMLSIGVMLISYSPFLHTNYPQIGSYIYYSFDIASSLFIPSLFFFFEKVFGNGPRGMIRVFRKIYTYLGIGFTVFMTAGFWLEDINVFYQAFGPLVFALSIVVSVFALVYFLYYYSKQRNKEAITISTGFSILAVLGLSEMVWFYIHDRLYQFFYWKIGIIVVIACLIIVLVRKALDNYNQMMKYSEQLEVFYNELQRSEKIEMISQLAASVAHEVRNPLQVTRGFLQLLRERTVYEKDKKYILLAVNELDRASNIITDFLTFAKPGIELHTRLNLSEEIQLIKAIILPLVTIQGGVLNISIEDDLFIRGNSSKFKQAIINIIKNSIEALGDNGKIMIHTMKTPDNKQVVLCIEDNGEGIEPEDLKHLGEPYYSKKTKGTGLGLMVTYRIIEAMCGEITYQSQIGIGTQVKIVFPIAVENADAVS